MRSAVVVLALAAGATATAGGEPRAMDEEARAHLESGLRAYRERAWGEAIRELRAGHAIDPHPDFLFPWAQATRLSGDCPGAIPLYRRALAAAASAEDRRDIESLIARCQEEVERERLPPPEDAAAEPAAPERAAPATATVEAAPSAAPSWYADRPGGALAIGGAVGLAAGALLFVAATGAEDEASSAATLDDFVAATDRADQRRLFATIALATGAALAAGAALRYGLVARRSSREPSLGLGPARGGAVVSLGGAF